MSDLPVSPNTMTVGGLNVTIFADCGEQERPLLGAYFNQMEWIACSWRRDGTWRNDDRVSDLDLVIVPAKVEGDAA